MFVSIGICFFLHLNEQDQDQDRDQEYVDRNNHRERNLKHTKSFQWCIVLFIFLLIHLSHSTLQQ